MNPSNDELKATGRFSKRYLASIEKAKKQYEKPEVFWIYHWPSPKSLKDLIALRNVIEKNQDRITFGGSHPPWPARKLGELAEAIAGKRETRNHRLQVAILATTILMGAASLVVLLLS